MKIGEIIENAIWLNGEETPEMVDDYKKRISESFKDLCEEHGFVCGPAVFVKKHPMDDRVPEVPDHIQGEVRLLVGEAKIIGVKGSFAANLENEDLEKLRAIIRKYRPMTDWECDEIIEELGPEAALDTLRIH